MQFFEKIRRGFESLPEHTALAALTASFVYTMLLIAPDKQLNDGDTLWHIVLGREILQKWSLPQTDRFSYVFNGEPYRTNSWLSDVLLGAAYDLGGFFGVVELGLLCVALTFFLLQREFLKSLSNRLSIYFCCAVLLLLSPHLLSRPHVLVFPLVALWAILLLRAEAEKRAPPMLALLNLFLWSNMHGSFLLAFVVTAPVALLGVFGDGAQDPERLREWGLFGLGMVAVTVIGPYGLNPLQTAFSVMSLGPLLLSIGEWRPENFSSFGSFEAVLLMMIGLLAFGGVRLSFARIALLLGLLHMALSHTRNSDYLAIIGSLLLAAPVGRAIGGGDLYLNSKRLLVGALGVAGVATLATVAFRTVAPPESAYPVAALRAARENEAQGRVFNDYAFGGALIFDGVKVFVDSRAEFYPKAILQEYLGVIDAADPAQLAAFLQKYDMGWSLLAPSQKIVALMDKLPGWRNAYRDEAAVVYVRTDPSPHPEDADQSARRARNRS
jgi:hypothetical protein